MKPFLVLSLASLCAFSQPVHAATADLAFLLAGNSLTEDEDVEFSNFDFVQFNPSKTGPFTGDFLPEPDEISVTSSSASGTVRLTFEFAPEVSISTDQAVFDFFIDFDVAVTGGSSRTLTGLTLGEGDLTASGTGSFAQVIFDDVLPIRADPRVEIFEDTNFVSQPSESAALADLTALSLFGRIEGETGSNDSTAGLSTFSLTFDLDGTPPITAIPLPASLPLILAGLGSLAFLRRRKRV